MVDDDEVDVDVLVDVVVEEDVVVTDDTVNDDTFKPLLTPNVLVLSSTCTSMLNDPTTAATIVHVAFDVDTPQPLDTFWLPMLHVYVYGAVPPAAAVV